jgi:hypothetical protein
MEQSFGGARQAPQNELREPSISSAISQVDGMVGKARQNAASKLKNRCYVSAGLAFAIDHINHLP